MGTVPCRQNRFLVQGFLQIFIQSDSKENMGSLVCNYSWVHCVFNIQKEAEVLEQV